jgi:hypothetical protein
MKMENDESGLKLRILYLEQELEAMIKYIRELEDKLKINPFTRVSFRNDR